jgi:PAS domain S-box-containing protein
MTSLFEPLQGRKQWPASPVQWMAMHGVDRIRYLMLLWVAGCTALGAVTWVCFRLQLSIATTGFIYLIVIVLLSSMDSYVSSVIFSMVAVVLLNYFFTPPLFAFQVFYGEDVTKLVAFLITSLVVTALIRQVRRLDEIQRRSQAVFLAEAQNLSLTGSFGWNATSGEIVWSEQTFRIFGFDPSMNPSIELVLQHVHPDDVSRVRQVIGQAATTRQDFDCEHRLLMPNGSVKHVHVVGHVATDKPSQLKFMGTIMDVTAAKSAEAQLQEAKAELAHVTRVTTLGELSASIAHEMGQPLASIVTDGEASLRWLDRPQPDLDEVRACVKRMIGDGRRAAEIVQRVRSLARRAAPQKTQLEINDVVRDVVSLINREVSDHRVALRLELASGLPPLLGDRVQLQQVLMNLVINGMQAMDDVGDRPRELLIESSQDGQGQLVVAVRDTGMGIDADNAGRVFAPFFTTKLQGMGMGLPICRSIIEAHGGEISASNNATHGATFRFSLPSAGMGAPA